jgi:hypothetical protein
MICPKCQSDNPELNRFCGMCGFPLQESEPQTPSAEAAAEDSSANQGRRPFIVSTTATGDAPLSNSRVVAPSPTIGSTTRSSYLPLSPLKARPQYEDLQNLPETEPATVDPLDEPIFAKDAHTMEMPPPNRQAVETTELRERNERRPIPIDNAPVSGSILGLGGAPLETDRYEYDEPTSRTVEEPIESVPEEVHSTRNSFLTFDDPTTTHTTDVSGPSFLGLGAEETPDYLLENQHSSHARGYLLLFALCVVGVLGFLEWRASSRGQSMNPVDVLHIKLPQKKGQGQAIVEPPPANSSASSTATPAGGNTNGKPDLIAEPTQPAAQPASIPPANSAAAPEASQSSTPAPKPADSTPANNTAASATPPAAIPTAKPGEDTTAQDEEPAAPAPKKPAAKKPVAVASAKPTPSRPAARDAENAPDPSLSAGSFELQKGIAAGATNEGRTWLWRAMGKGNGEAPVLLADIYAQGRGTPKDCEQAVLLLKAAAKKANPRARSKLGTMYASGQCVPQDRVEAYKWMHAALQVNPGSEWIQKNQESLWSRMSASERRRAAAYR